METIATETPSFGEQNLTGLGYVKQSYAVLAIGTYAETVSNNNWNI